MSDHDAAPDPIDAAYARGRGGARRNADDAARRPAAPGCWPLWRASRAPLIRPPRRRPARRVGGWGRGGWLAAACVAGLSVFVGLQIYQPVPRPPQVAPSAPVSAPPLAGAPPGAPAAAVSKRPRASRRRAPDRAACSGICAPHGARSAAGRGSVLVCRHRSRAPGVGSGGGQRRLSRGPTATALGAAPRAIERRCVDRFSASATTVSDEVVTRQTRAQSAAPRASANSIVGRGHR